MEIPKRAISVPALATKTIGAAIARHFARVTSSGRLIPEIDGLRFLAISGVVLYHCMQQVAARNGVSAYFGDHQGADRFVIWLLSQGRLGVQFFFVISGFVLGLQYSERHYGGRPKPSLGRFYFRRLTRLEPPYAVNLLLSYLLVATLFVFGLRAKGAGFSALLPHLAASLVYLHGFIYHDMSLVNGITWSLEVEAQFYLLMPLIGSLIYLIHGNRVRAAILLAAIVAHGAAVGAVHDTPWYFQFTLAGYLCYFLTGILLADLYCARPDGPASDDVRWDLAALGALAVALVSEFYSGYEGHFALLFGVVSWAALSGRYLRMFLRLTPIWIVGGMCYSIYLYHLWVIALGAQALRFAYRHDYPFWRNYFELFPWLCIAVLVISAGFFLVLERPCMERDWPKRFLRKMTGGPRQH
jgi:peptidoglycan/LPS O-acetylase OafA/YrhL